jgi:hypothetical protein
MKKRFQTLTFILILRQFCRIYFNPLPNKSTLYQFTMRLHRKELRE